MITQQEYADRRKALSAELLSASVTIVHSASHKTRSNDTEYPFRQNSNFYYLTGFKEDSAALLIVKGRRDAKFYLFVAKKDPAQELWSGKRVGAEAAKELMAFDEVYEYEMLEKIFKEHLAKKHTFYYDFGDDSSKLYLLRGFCSGMYTHKNIAKLISKMRLIKSPTEIALIKKALSITQQAHHRAMQIVSKMEYEYELQAEIEYVFKRHGAYSDAYTSIVAAANAANTLHYVDNDKKIPKDALILIDAGCEYDYYASDITRTIPASGKFSDAQRELYEMVLDVEKEIVSMIKPGVLRSKLQKESERLLCEGMVRVGILSGSVTTLLKRKAHKKYYPHGIGHWMGLDVHDEALYKTEQFKEIPLDAGMVLTIEPGIYLDENDKNIPERFRGIGIRIEDDILVTQEGCENLSSGIAKEIHEIEALAQNR